MPRSIESVSESCRFARDSSQGELADINGGRQPQVDNTSDFVDQCNCRFGPSCRNCQLLSVCFPSKCYHEVLLFRNINNQGCECICYFVTIGLLNVGQFVNDLMSRNVRQANLHTEKTRLIGRSDLIDLRVDYGVGHLWILQIVFQH